MKKKLFIFNVFFSIIIFFNVSITSATPRQNVIDTFYLDTFSETPAIGNTPLRRGLDYLIKIDGTASLWSPDWWKTQCEYADQAEGSPRYPSEKTKNGKVGVDPAYFFAWPKDSPSLCVNPPKTPPLQSSLLEFSTDGGNTWFKRDTVEKQYKTTHTYFYEILGDGKQLQLRFNDSHGDDYGKFHIEIIDRN